MIRAQCWSRTAPTHLESGQGACLDTASKPAAESVDSTHTEDGQRAGDLLPERVFEIIDRLTSRPVVFHVNSSTEAWTVVRRRGCIENINYTGYNACRTVSGIYCSCIIPCAVDLGDSGTAS